MHYIPFSYSSGHLVLVYLGLAHSVVALTILHLISNSIIFFGGYLMCQGWMLIHGSKGEEPVTIGVYSYAAVIPGNSGGLCWILMERSSP